MEHTVRFAVVREDPSVEVELIRGLKARSVLFLASGGCTALSVKRQHPDVEVVVFDPDPAQLDHVRAKADAAARGDSYALNVGDASSARLNQRGALEGLFRIFRHYLVEFVVRDGEIEDFFSPDTSWTTRMRLGRAWMESERWPAAFETAFAVPSLDLVYGGPMSDSARVAAMPKHFRRAIERGLRHEHAGRNPVLQHVFLGCYYEDDAPSYARSKGLLPIHLAQGALPDVPDLGRFDLVSLSSAMDWLHGDHARQWIAALAAGARPGCHVVLRQLGGDNGLRGAFSSGFSFDEALGAAMTERESSGFCDRVEVAVRT